MSIQLYAKNKKQLARLIGISHQSLSKLMEREDRPPLVEGKGWLIEQWKRYANANIEHYRNNTSINKVRVANANLRDEAYIKRQEMAAAREAFDLEVKRGKYVLKSDASDLITTNVSSFCRELDKAFRHELPPRLEGITAQEIAKLLGTRLDAERIRMAKAFSSNGSGNGSIH